MGLNVGSVEGEGVGGFVGADGAMVAGFFEGLKEGATT